MRDHEIEVPEVTEFYSTTDISLAPQMDLTQIQNFCDLKDDSVSSLLIYIWVILQYLSLYCMSASEQLNIVSLPLSIQEHGNAYYLIIDLHILPYGYAILLHLCVTPSIDLI